jgi:hypothetical protein
MTYDDRLNIAQCARQRGQQAAADGDRPRYYRETAASFWIVGRYGNAATFDRLAEVEA